MVGAAERAEGRKSARHTWIRALEGELAAIDGGDLRALVGAPARISGIGGGIDRGPELGGQLIDVVEPQRDLVRADDPATPVFSTEFASRLFGWLLEIPAPPLGSP